jgi:hypothetical protein
VTDLKLSGVFKTMFGVAFFQEGVATPGMIIVVIAVLSLLAAYSGFYLVAYLLAVVWCFLVSGGVRTVCTLLGVDYELNRSGEPPSEPQA